MQVKQSDLMMSYEWKAKALKSQATRCFAGDEQFGAYGVKHMAKEVQFSYLY